MTFDIAAFVRTNRTILIWVGFFFVLFLVRKLIGLVFLTFVMCFITQSVLNILPLALQRHRRLFVVLIYLFFLILIGVFLFVLMPRLAGEASGFTEQLPRSIRLIESWVQEWAEEYPVVLPVIDQIREGLTPERLIMEGLTWGRALVQKGVQYVSWFFLAFMFSFLIMLDLPRLARGTAALSKTKIGPVYDELSGSIVRFGRVVGKSFRAQIVVSAISTVLTGIGLTILGVDGKILLLSVLFLGGLIPFLGAIISFIPTFLMAVNSGGIMTGFWVTLLLIGTSLLETYVLNPRIVSSVMRINPIVTLIILYIGYLLIGLWGMLLGVPVAVFLYRQITVGGRIDSN